MSTRVAAGCSDQRDAGCPSRSVAAQREQSVGLQDECERVDDVEQIADHTPFGEQSFPVAEFLRFAPLRDFRPVRHGDGELAFDDLFVQEYLDAKPRQAADFFQCVAQQFFFEHPFPGDKIQTDDAEYEQAVLPQAQADIGSAGQNGGGKRGDVLGSKPLEIGIEQHQELVACCCNAAGHGNAFALIVRVGNERDRWKTADDFSGLVGGAVVHDDHLSQQRMSDDGLQNRADSWRFIECTDDTGDAGGNG